VVPNAAAVEGHAGEPPPPVGVVTANVNEPVPTLKTTRWNAVSVPTDALIVFGDAKPLNVIPTGAVVTKKVFIAGARAYRVVVARVDASAGQAVGVEPKPVTAVGAGALKESTCPVNRVPTAAETTLPVMPVTGTAVAKVDTRKLPLEGAAA